MGMFDNIQYKDKWYQTKDTPNQALDNFKIEADQESGHEYLWEEKYDAEWVHEPDVFLGGFLKHSNERWVRSDDFDGKIIFYMPFTNDEGKRVWHEYHALFMNGKMIKIEDRTKDE